MKKTYSNPEMEIVKIATQQMLAVSGIDTTNNRAGLSTQSATEGVNAGARQGWFDDADDE